MWQRLKSFRWNKNVICMPLGFHIFFIKRYMIFIKRFMIFRVVVWIFFICTKIVLYILSYIIIRHTYLVMIKMFRLPFYWVSLYLYHECIVVNWGQKFSSSIWKYVWTVVSGFRKKDWNLDFYRAMKLQRDAERTQSFKNHFSR